MKFLMTQTDGKSLCESVELNSINDLLLLISTLEDPIIISRNYYDGSDYNIEIYNDYRE